jgi:hypothetical protein
MNTRQIVVSTMLIAAAVCIEAASPSIGFVVARGSFQLDNSRIWNNATLFDGSTIETKAVPSRIHLSDGSEVRMAAESRLKVYLGRAVLEKGVGRLQSSTKYQVEARTLHIAAGDANTVAEVRLREPAGVTVAALSGKILVSNVQGVLVVDLGAGQAVTLDPSDAGAPGSTKVSGCLLAKGGKSILVDQVTNVTFELHGNGLEREIGNRVQITGTAEPDRPSVAGASQVVNVIELTQIGKGGCSSAAKKAGAAGAHATVAGFAPGTVAIVGGVAVAATVGGLAAAGEFSSSAAEAQPSTSR